MIKWNMLPYYAHNGRGQSEEFNNTSILVRKVGKMIKGETLFRTLPTTIQATLLNPD